MRNPIRRVRVLAKMHVISMVATRAAATPAAGRGGTSAAILPRMTMSSGSVSALEVAPTQPAKRRRPATGNGVDGAGRHGTAILVTDQGHMRMAPLISAMLRELAPGAETQLR